MQSSVLQGILLPFWGTSLGAACVFCLQRAPSAVLRRVLEGFAAGVMTAASVWSLLLPAIDWADMGRWSFLPAAGGFWLGVLFLRLLERLLPEAVTDRSTTMTLLAVTLHNIPEGMAVGAAYAGCVAAGAAAPAAAFTLALAIAIQNVPEGAIVALPLRTAGAGKGRAFLGGVLSGAVEPLAAGVTCWRRRSSFRRCPGCWALPPGPCSMWWPPSCCPRAATPARGRWLLPRALP